MAASRANAAGSFEFLSSEAAIVVVFAPSNSLFSLSAALSGSAPCRSHLRFLCKCRRSETIVNTMRDLYLSILVVVVIIMVFVVVLEGDGCSSDIFPSKPWPTNQQISKQAAGDAQIDSTSLARMPARRPLVRNLAIIIACALLLSVLLFFIGLLPSRAAGGPGKEMVDGSMRAPTSISNLLTLLPGQHQVLASLKKMQSFRERYNSMLVPVLDLRRDNISRSERLLLEPLTLQLRAWGILEELLLSHLRRWLQAGSLEMTARSSFHDVRGRLSLAYLRERYRAVAHGCSLAISDLQRTVLNLEQVRNEATQRQPSLTEDTIEGSAAEVNRSTSSGTSNNHTFHPESWSWVEMVKHDLGDLVSQLEASNGESLDVRRRHQAGAPLETVLITDGREGGTNAGAPPGVPLTLMDSHGNRYVLSRPANPALASEDGRFIRDLCLLLVTGLLLGYMARGLLGLPALVGHLVAGLLLGFSCLDQIASLVGAQSLGQLALLLLIYRLGATGEGDDGRGDAIMTSASGRRRVRPRVETSPPVQRTLPSTLATLGLGMLLAVILLGTCVGLMLTLGSILFAVPPLQAVLAGLILSFSSTILAVRMLEDLLLGPVSSGDLFMTILLVQDGLFCLSLSLLPLLAGSSVGGAGTLGTFREILGRLAADLGKIVLLLISLSLLRFVWSRRQLLLPPSAPFPSPHPLRASGKFMLVSLIAWSTHTLIGLNLEMALFISSLRLNDNSGYQRESLGSDHGASVHHKNNTNNDDDHNDHGQAHVQSRSRSSSHSGELASLFFFASIGLLLDVRFLVRELALLLGLATGVMVVKFVLLVVLLSVTRAVQSSLTITVASWPAPLHMALAMCQVSELALMLGLRARHLHLISPECYYLLAGITVLSLIASPVLAKGLSKRAKCRPEHVIMRV